MKENLTIISAFLAIIVPSLTSAQSQESSMRIGLGAALSFLAPIKENSAAQKSMIVPEFLLPFDIIEHIRIEPVFGISRSTYSSESKDEQFTATQTQSESLMRLGMGFIYTSEIGNNVQLNIGIRPSFLLSAKKSELMSNSTINATSVHTTALNIAGTFGGEYFLGKKFSLGLEVHLNYYREGNPRIEPVALSPSTSTLTAMFTSSFITARLYL